MILLKVILLKNYTAEKIVLLKIKHFLRGCIFSTTPPIANLGRLVEAVREGGASPPVESPRCPGVEPTPRHKTRHQ